VNVQAEVSLYPLRTPRLSKPIEHFREALEGAGLRLETGNMSTLVSGDLNGVFDGLKSAVAAAGEGREIVLVVKLSNACPSGSEPNEKELS
jgi:uncharacterized protein YqgV (UPF0045/DUF77 family)